MRPASGRSRANFEEPEQQMLKIVRNLDNPLKSGLLQQPAKLTNSDPTKGASETTQAASTPRPIVGRR
jgi:hypothetical protein